MWISVIILDECWVLGLMGFGKLIFLLFFINLIIDWRLLGLRLFFLVKLKLKFIFRVISLFNFFIVVLISVSNKVFKVMYINLVCNIKCLFLIFLVVDWL